jgi:hypothetical protein
MIRRETAEHEVGTRLKRHVVALLGRQREIFKMGLAVVARIYPYDHARAPSHRDYRARKGVVHAITDDETSGILAPHASTGRYRKHYINARDRKPPVLDWAATCSSEVAHQEAAVDALGLTGNLP